VLDHFKKKREQHHVMGGEVRGMHHGKRHDEKKEQSSTGRETLGEVHTKRVGGKK